MKKTFLTFLVTLFINGLLAQEADLKSENIVINSKLKFTRCNPALGEVKVVGQGDYETPILSFETKVRPKFIYNVSSSIPLKKQALKKGQVVLLSFKGKTMKSGLETGEARYLWILKQSDSYKGNIEATISLPKDWKTFYVPFTITQDVLQKDLGLVVQSGFPPQIGLITNIKFQVFPEGTPLASLPKTAITYKGMEADAAWRTQAFERIEKNRKGDFSLQFHKNGKPVIAENVKITLQNHHFLWGAMVYASDITSSIPHVINLKKGFNLAVLGNDLKIKSWSREKNRIRTLESLKILNQNNVKIKGHVLIWPGYHYLTPNFKQNENNPKKIVKLMQAHLDDILKKTKGSITSWDVVNEAYTNRSLQTITGSEDILYNGFKVVKKMQPKAARFTNEYGIISKGGIDTQKQQWYFEYIKRLDKNTGGLVDGIGLQCHMGSDLTTPVKTLELLDYYGQLNKKISISEFTMDLTDPEIRYRYTSDFLIAAFSHPNVSEFLFWGFQSINPKAVIYNNDWSLAPMGQAFFDLVHNKWKTNINKSTTQEGTLKGRGFYGVYSYSFMHNGKLVKGEFEINPNKNNVIKITL